MTTVSNGAAGFIFWIIAAKLYSNEAVGITTAILSSITLLVLLSRLGFDQSVIKFFPDRNRNVIFSTSIIIPTVTAILIGLLFVNGIDILSPELKIIKPYIIPYLVFLSASSCVSITGASFIALRKAEYYFFQSILINARIILLLPLLSLGIWGIFGSIAIATILSLIVSMLIIFKMGIIPSKMDKSFLHESIHFSIANYISSLLMTGPSAILPILTLNLLGAKDTANYYMAYTISSMLFMIPFAFGTSMFVEGCNGESLRKITYQALFATIFFLFPSVIFLFTYGDFMLGLVGECYKASFGLLRIMVLSSFFVAICNISLSIKRVKNEVIGLIFLSGIIFILVIGMSYIFMINFGLIGIGYAWAFSYIFTSFIILILAIKERLI
jgi:O-antigen/teichoic acid export membrane protein